MKELILTKDGDSNKLDFEKVEKYHQDMRNGIKEHGFMVQAVKAAAEDRYAYTVGLSMTRGWPEIFISGNFEYDQAQVMIEQTILRWRLAGKPIIGEVNLSHYFTDEFRFATVPMDKAKAMELMMAVNTYKGDMNFKAVQLLWSGKDGILPTEHGYKHDHRLMIQPLYMEKQ